MTCEACKTELTQNIPPLPYRNVNERVQDGEGHRGYDGSAVGGRMGGTKAIL